MAGRHITFTKEIGQQVLAARKVGATLRECVKAAGVAWPTFCRWRRMRDDGKHDDIAAFFVELDKAEVFYLNTLRERATAGTKDDPRLAFDMLRWHDARQRVVLDLKARKLDVEIKQAQLAALKADAESGTTTDAFDALARLIARRVADAKPDAESDLAGDAEP